MWSAKLTKKINIPPFTSNVRIRTFGLSPKIRRSYIRKELVVGLDEWKIKTSMNPFLIIQDWSI